MQATANLATGMPVAPRVHMRTRGLVVAVCLAACGGDRDGTYDFNSHGAALYQQMCSVCHGETGEGGLGPKLLDTARSTDELRGAISARMPQNNPGQCTGTCADEVAAFIKEGLTTRATSCPRGHGACAC